MDGSPEPAPTMLVRQVLSTEGEAHVLFAFVTEDGKEFANMMPANAAAEFGRLCIQHAEGAKASEAFYKFLQQKLNLPIEGATAMYQDFVVFVQTSGIMDIPEVKGYGGADGVPDDISSLFDDRNDQEG